MKSVDEVIEGLSRGVLDRAHLEVELEDERSRRVALEHRIKSVVFKLLHDDDFSRDDVVEQLQFAVGESKRGAR